jgi:hypothetical protein
MRNISPPTSGSKKKIQQEPASTQVASRILEVICSSETSVASQQTTQHHIPEVYTLHNHRCENLKSYKRGNCFNTKERKEGRKMDRDDTMYK